MDTRTAPKWIAAIGAIVLVGIAVFVVVEKRSQRDDQRLAAGTMTLSEEERRALEQEVVTATQELADADSGNDFNAHVKIALAKEKLGDREGAAAVYRSMNRQYPGNYLSFQNLGMLYQEDKKCDFASEQFRQAIRNAPRIALMYRNFVNLATYDCQQYAQDIPRMLQDGLAVLPDSVDLTSMMAVYHRDFGNVEDAIHWYELLLVFDQSNTAALDELKQLQQRRTSGEQERL